MDLFSPFSECICIIIPKLRFVNAFCKKYFYYLLFSLFSDYFLFLSCVISILSHFYNYIGLFFSYFKGRILIIPLHSASFRLRIRLFCRPLFRVIILPSAFRFSKLFCCLLLTNSGFSYSLAPNSFRRLSRSHRSTPLWSARFLAFLVKVRLVITIALSAS